MASVPDEESTGPHDADDLDSLVAEHSQAAIDAAAGAHDDTIDLAALAKLSHAPRSSDAPRGVATSLAGVAAPALRLRSTAPHAAESFAPIPRRGGSRALAWAALVLGFALGVPAGAFLFGRPASSPGAVAATPAPSVVTASAAQAPLVPTDDAVHHAAALVEPPHTALAAKPSAGGHAAPVGVAATAPTQAAIPLTLAQRVLASAAARPTTSAAYAEPARAEVVAASAPAAPQAAAAAPVLEVHPVAAPAAVPIETEQAAAKPAHAPAAANMDSLLDDALSPRARAELSAKQNEALAPAELPLAPTRDDVGQAMTVLLPAIRGCAMGQTGLATAAIVVRNDGHVASVNVAGAPFEGTASGRCMEGVVRRAHFPRFKQPTFRVQFPFAIQ